MTIYTMLSKYLKTGFNRKIGYLRKGEFYESNINGN